MKKARSVASSYRVGKARRAAKDYLAYPKSIPQKRTRYVKSLSREFYPNILCIRPTLLVMSCINKKSLTNARLFHGHAEVSISGSDQNLIHVVLFCVTNVWDLLIKQISLAARVCRLISEENLQVATFLVQEDRLLRPV